MLDKLTFDARRTLTEKRLGRLYHAITEIGAKQASVRYGVSHAYALKLLKKFVQANETLIPLGARLEVGPTAIIRLRDQAVCKLNSYDFQKLTNHPEAFLKARAAKIKSTWDGILP